LRMTSLPRGVPSKPCPSRMGVRGRPIIGWRHLHPTLRVAAKSCAPFPEWARCSAFAPVTAPGYYSHHIIFQTTHNRQCLPLAMRRLPKPQVTATRSTRKMGRRKKKEEQMWARVVVRIDPNWISLGLLSQNTTQSETSQKKKKKGLRIRKKPRLRSRRTEWGNKLWSAPHRACRRLVTGRSAISIGI